MTLGSCADVVVVTVHALRGAIAAISIDTYCKDGEVAECEFLTKDIIWYNDVDLSFLFSYSIHIKLLVRLVKSLRKWLCANAHARKV